MHRGDAHHLLGLALQVPVGRHPRVILRRGQLKVGGADEHRQHALFLQGVFLPHRLDAKGLLFKRG